MEDGRLLEDEELDDALEREFQRAQSPPVPKDPTSPSLLHNSSHPSSLTFSFPGWGVQIFRDSKRRKAFIIRQALQEDAQNQQEEAEFRTLALGFADDPGNGYSVYQVPSEIMVKILKRLSIRDLCSAMRTCHWWQHLGCQDDVWQQFHGINETPIPLPRWGLVKHDALSLQVQSGVQNREVSGRGYFCIGFSHLRNALRTWWVTEKPSEPYGSKSIGGLLHKISVRDWTMLYEFLGVIFSERADCLAALLMQEVKKQADKHVAPICPFGCDHQSRTEEDEAVFTRNDDLVVFSSIYASEGQQSCVEGLIGKSLWGIVYLFWKRYKQWLMLIFEHCPRLNFQVTVEKARATAWTTTPSLYEKGVICFRSQILLRYGLRRILQSGYTLLTCSDANGLTSEYEVDLLQSIQHLLQEVDVSDDSLSTQPFTQTKLRRCFPVRRLSDSQARHNQDKNKKFLSSS